MNYLKQFCLILLIWALGEYLSQFLSTFIFIPGNILGMLLLLLGLMSGIIKEQYIQDVAQFLLNHMALFFIPLAVNILGQSLNLDFFMLVIITLITTPIIMIVTTFTTDKLMKLKEKHS